MNLKRTFASGSESVSESDSDFSWQLAVGSWQLGIITIPVSCFPKEFQMSDSDTDVRFRYRCQTQMQMADYRD